MEIDDLKKDMDNVGLPHKKKQRQPDFSVKKGNLKAAIIKVLALLLLLTVMAFGLLVVSYYRSPVMALIVLVYLAMGGFLAYKLWSLTYTGWLYTLYLTAAGILLSIITLINRGFSSQTLVLGILAVMIVSLISFALLWWAKDLLGIKNYHEIFMPYK